MNTMEAVRSVIIRICEDYNMEDKKEEMFQKYLAEMDPEHWTNHPEIQYQVEPVVEPTVEPLPKFNKITKTLFNKMKYADLKAIASKIPDIHFKTKKECVEQVYNFYSKNKAQLTEANKKPQVNNDVLSDEEIRKAMKKLNAEGETYDDFIDFLESERVLSGYELDLLIPVLKKCANGDVPWDELIYKCKPSQKFIVTFKKNLDWEYLCRCYDLTEDTIRKCRDMITYWSYIEDHQNVSESFLRKYSPGYDGY